MLSVGVLQSVHEESDSLGVSEWSPESGNRRYTSELPAFLIVSTDMQLLDLGRGVWMHV